MKLGQGIWPALCLTLLLGGCKGSNPESYTPSGDSAKLALEAALSAWRDGKQPAEVAGVAGGPAVQIVDSEWVAGKKLKSFAIEDEVAPAGASPDSVARQFAVKLEYEDGPPHLAVYHIVGKDPLVVFRDKDFTQASGM